MAAAICRSPVDIHSFTIQTCVLTRDTAHIWGLVQIKMGRGKARRWLTVLVLVALAHGGAWYFISHLRHDVPPPAALPIIEVALLPPPPLPEKKVLPPPPQPPKALPPSRTKPEPRPLLQPQPVAERVIEQVAEPSRPVLPTSPTPIVQAAPEPVLEAPRFNAAYLNNPPPAYPLMARRRSIEGRVLVRAEVQADGACSRVELKKTSGSELLDQAALDAVKKWRFIPAKKGDQALTAWVEVPITFKLEN